MTTTNLLPTQAGLFTLGATDSATPPVARSASFNVKVTDYSLGYVQVSQGNQLYFVPKGVGTTTITITAASADSTAIPSVTMQFITTLTPPPPDPQATTLTLSPVQIIDINITTPHDPGVDNVSGNL